MTETAQKVYDSVDIIKDEVLKKESLHSFLKIAGKFPDIDFINQLLLWKQMPEAEFVAGKNAYKSNGGTVFEDAIPIAFLIPQKDDEKGLYRAVPVYDISNVKDISVTRKEAGMKDIFMFIRQKTHMPVVAGGKKMLGEELSRFDPEKELFIIRDAMTEKEKIRQLILMYVDFFMCDNKSSILEKKELAVLTALIKIAVQSGLGYDPLPDMTDSVWVILNTMEKEERIILLQSAADLSGQILKEMNIETVEIYKGEA